MSSRQIDRAKYIGHKIVDRTKDSFFNFTHAQLIRNMVTAAELDLVKREPCDKNLILIAFYPTGGFGDYIISSKLLDELLLSVPCRIDVFCENVTFGNAVYAARPAVRVLPYESLYACRYMYDVVLRVEHFIHVLSWNAHHIAKIAPEFADKLSALGKNMKTVRPEIEQQYFREALHFQRSRFLGINRWTELRCGGVFRIPDEHTYVPLKKEGLMRLREIGLLNCRYLTMNRGADSMGRSGMQTKVWPLEHYEKLAALLKQRFLDIRIVQIGAKGNSRIAGADMHILGESMEVTKWLLRGSLLHIDCEGGLVHLAVQMAVKCIVLFGPTPLHTYAYPSNSNLVSEKCSGCMGLHPDWAFSCLRDLKKPECMDSITPARVLSAAEKHLAGSDGKNKEKNKHITKIEADTQNGRDYSRLYESCRRKNPLLTMQRAYAGMYDAVLMQAEKLGKHAKIALVYPKRDFIGWYLMERGFAVVEFDPDYGYSGQLGDTIFNRMTSACLAHGMDMRLGSGRQIPYAADSFDLAAVFRQNIESRGYGREMERILKQDGCLIQIGKTAGSKQQ